MKVERSQPTVHNHPESTSDTTLERPKHIRDAIKRPIRIAAGTAIVALLFAAACTEETPQSKLQPTTTTNVPRIPGLSPGQRLLPRQDTLEAVYGERTAHATAQYGDTGVEVDCYQTATIESMPKGTTLTDLAKISLQGDSDLRIKGQVHTQIEPTDYVDPDGEVMGVYQRFALDQSEVDQLAAKMVPNIAALNGNRMLIAGEPGTYAQFCFGSPFVASTPGD